jgi:hypothetical protein
LVCGETLQAKNYWGTTNPFWFFDAGGGLDWIRRRRQIPLTGKGVQNNGILS